MAKVSVSSSPHSGNSQPQVAPSAAGKARGAKVPHVPVARTPVPGQMISTAHKKPGMQRGFKATEMNSTKKVGEVHPASKGVHLNEKMKETSGVGAVKEKFAREHVQGKRAVEKNVQPPVEQVEKEIRAKMHSNVDQMKGKFKSLDQVKLYGKVKHGI